MRKVFTVYMKIERHLRNRQEEDRRLFKIYKRKTDLRTLYTTAGYKVSVLLRSVKTTVGKMKGHDFDDTVKSIVAKYPRTGVDSMVTMLLDFPRGADQGGPAHAVASCSLGLSNGTMAETADASAPNVRIQGQQGEIQVFPPTYRPTHTRLILKDGTVEDKKWPQPGPGVGSGWYSGFGPHVNPEGKGHELFWGADDAGRAIIERKEGSCLGLDETILIMEVMDGVRRDAGLEYQKELETTDYAVKF